METTVRNITLVSLMILGSSLASAQVAADVFFGGGTATAKSNNKQMDTFGDGTTYKTPSLDGAFGTTGASLMVTPKFGFGGQVSFRFAKGDYAGLKYRPIFYDFNGIYRPIHTKRIVPEFQAGLGGVNTKFYYSESSCNDLIGCSNSTSSLGSSNHFQLHAAAGLRLYATQHIFIRPQFDLHWVNNFSQFGSNIVPQYSVAIGYNFGEH